jgi:hypothetical protein
MCHHLYIVWRKFQRRPLSMQSFFGYRVAFLRLSFSSKYLRPLEYFWKALQTLLICFQKKPQILWIQLPPTPILYTVQFYKIAFARQTKIIADCHNAMLRDHWLRWPGTIAMLNYCDLVLVHNDEVLSSAKTLGLCQSRLMVLEDAPADPIIQQLAIPTHTLGFCFHALLAWMNPWRLSSKQPV